MSDTKWLLFMPQVPSLPSSLRVSVWRRLRVAGAVSLQNGVWVLPAQPKHVEYAKAVLAEVRSSGGNGVIVSAELADGMTDQDLEDRFRGERDAEYAEFSERCAALQAEIAKESSQCKFTYAELEENDEELKKLAGWLLKIRDRDHFGGNLADKAQIDLDTCRQTLEMFAQSVYAREGIGGSGDSN